METKNLKINTAPLLKQNYAKSIHQVQYFLIVGLITTAVQYFFLWVLVEANWLNAPMASGVGYLISACLSYVLNYFLTFQSNASHFRAGKRFIIMIAIGWLLTYAIMHFLVSNFNLHYFIAQLFTTALVFFLNFILSRFWVF